MSAAENSKSPSKPLSAKAIEAMKPNSPVKADVGENAGLRVKCGSTGVKTFFYRYKSPETDKLTQFKIGNFPSTSLAEARMALEQLKVLRKSGVCPKAQKKRDAEELAAKKREQASVSQQQAFTVNALVELYLSEHIEDRYVKDPRNPDKRKKIAGARKPKGQAEVRRTLYCDAVRALGERPAKEVTRKDVVSLVMEIVNRGANVQAGNVLRELSAAYEYAIGLERFPDEFANPALLAKASLKQAKVKLTHTKGKRALNDSELAAVLRWLPDSAFSPKQQNVIRLSLLTGCRSGEVCEAQWRDINLKEGTWHIRNPKNGAARYVQLPRQAVELLNSIETKDGVFVFPSSLKGKHIQQKTLTEAKWRMRQTEPGKNSRQVLRPEQRWLTSIDDWAIHDLRRTVRTGLSRMGCPSAVAEAVLGHSRKGIEGTYDLHAYEAECREWLQRWADHIDEIKEVNEQC